MRNFNSYLVRKKEKMNLQILDLMYRPPNDNSGSIGYQEAKEDFNMLQDKKN